MISKRVQHNHTTKAVTTEWVHLVYAHSLFSTVFIMILRKQCPIFPLLPSLPRHFLLLWLHNHSRLYYKLLSNEKETSACSGIHFLTMGPFVLIKSGNGKERERKRETDREGGRLSFKVAPVTVLPRGPQSEGWRKERRDGV